MENLDRWTTPKQIKIERAGDPRPLRRGPLKKRERRKGSKARRDELLSSKQTLLRYADYIVRDRKTKAEHPEWYRHPNHYDFHWEKHFDEHEKKHFKLIDAAAKDGVIDDPTLWTVIKP